MDHIVYEEQNVLGKIEIAPEVIQTIAGLTTSQIDGVAELKGGVVGDLNRLIGRKNVRQGTQVEIAEQTSIEIAMVVEYGYQIIEVAKEVQEKVKSAVETMTGLTVEKVVVRVEGIKVPSIEKSKDDIGNKGNKRVK
jgi:uncharacterized alkaline shock family protein YloU